MDLEAIGKQITKMKIGIGVIDHHTLQVESPTQVAELIRLSLQSIPAERLMLMSDCGMGREGMSRRHAFYKMASLVQGTNIVKRGDRTAGNTLPGGRSSILADQRRKEEVRRIEVNFWKIPCGLTAGDFFVFAFSAALAAAGPLATGVSRWKFKLKNQMSRVAATDQENCWICRALRHSVLRGLIFHRLTPVAN